VDLDGTPVQGAVIPKPRPTAWVWETIRRGGLKGRDTSHMGFGPTRPGRRSRHGRRRRSFRARYDVRMVIDPRNIEVMDDDMAEVFRAMTGAQRLKIASDLFRSARTMIASHLAAEHPDWDQQRLQEEVARRLSHGAV
jgi:Rv0078B-related antitoxin